MGPPGPLGIPGPSGVSGYEIVFAATPATPAPEQGISARCTTGKRVLGGEVETCSTVPSHIRPDIVATVPDGNAGWAGKAGRPNNPTAIPWGIRDYAILTNVAP